MPAQAHSDIQKMPPRRTSARALCGAGSAGNKKVAQNIVSSKDAYDLKDLDYNQFVTTDSALQSLNDFGSFSSVSNECENIMIGGLSTNAFHSNESVFCENGSIEALNLLNIEASALPMEGNKKSVPEGEDKKIGLTQLVQPVRILEAGEQSTLVSPVGSLNSQGVKKRLQNESNGPCSGNEQADAELDASCDRAIMLMKRDQKTLTFEEQREVKRYMRLLKNRESAQLSRHRKKMHLTALEMQVSYNLFFFFLRRWSQANVSISKTFYRPGGFADEGHSEPRCPRPGAAGGERTPAQANSRRGLGRSRAPRRCAPRAARCRRPSSGFVDVNDVSLFPRSPPARAAQCSLVCTVLALRSFDKARPWSLKHNAVRSRACIPQNAGKSLCTALH